MKLQVVFLRSAEVDLYNLKSYITANFSVLDWKKTNKKIKTAILNLKKFPKAGKPLPEITSIGLNQYYQIISGKNRAIYELRENIIYIHVICDVRKDVKSILTKRLLRA